MSSSVHRPFENSASRLDLPPSIRDAGGSISEKSLGSMRELLLRETNDDRHSVAAEQKVQEFAQAVASLSYREYLLLVDLLHRLRVDHSLPFAENSNAVLKQYRGETGLVPSGDPPSALECAINSLRALQMQPDFRDDALLTTRAAYPFGMNVVNKTFDPKQRFALDALERHTIVNGDASYRVTPANGAVTISLEDQRICLHDGQAAILGRNFLKHDLFGVQVNGSCGISIPSSLSPSPKSERGVSRAGLLLLLNDGQLYVFDRGSRYPVEIISKNTATIFRPDKVDNDGTIGESCSMSVEDYRRLKNKE